MRIISAKQEWELLLLCLKLSHKETSRPQEWAEAAKVQAEKMASALGFAFSADGSEPDPGEGDAPAAAAAPSGSLLAATPGATGGATPQGAKASPFGPAFTGWDTPALRMILIGAQQIVIGRAGGATPEQLKECHDDMMKGVDQLEQARKGG